MNLVIDIGNTRIKVAKYNEHEILQLDFYSSTDSLLEIINSYRYKNLIISNVGETSLDNLKGIDYLLFSNSTPIPIYNKYKSESLGVDRIAAAVGASELFPKQPLLVVDFGSAITIDFVNCKREYIGGNISPGMLFRFKALHNFSAHLPLVDFQGDIFLHAQTTQDAIRSGVCKGISFEIKQYIELYRKKYPKLKVIFSGGDANFFAKTLKKRIFVAENLVLDGLNTILKYNI
ncbi:MAG: type III pantothenate kinase [Bacteroidales bacterium]|nr:type III pantothenate kinase [Bacteroidales bacterium]